MSQGTENLEQEQESIEISHPETLSVWGLAWPPILGNLLWSSVGIISIKAVGSLGAEAVAAVGTGQRLVWVFRSCQHYANSDYWPQIRKVERVTIMGDTPR